MTWQLSPHILALLLSAALSAAVAVYTWPRRRNPGALALFAIMMAAVVWTVGYALQEAAVGVRWQFFWVRVEYLGIVPVPTLWLLFALDYTGRGRRWRRLALWLAPVPLATAIAIWTNPLHRFFWTDLGAHPLGSFITLRLTPGLGFWLHTGYSYVLLLAGTLLLLSALVRSPLAYRSQLIAALLGVAAPWLANALTIFGVFPVPHLDLTPFAFVLSGLCFGFGLLRLQLLDLVPVARDIAVERMTDSFIVLDPELRVIDLNPAARRLLAQSPRSAFGRPLVELLPAVDGVLARSDAAPLTDQIALQLGSSLCHYDVELQSTVSSGRAQPGFLLVMHDVTNRHRTEVHLRQLKEEADSANRAKSRFFAHMNHELRNPLTGVIAHADMLEQQALGDLNEEQLDSVRAIMSSGSQLLEIINESLDMARIEADRVTFFVEEFALADVVNEVVDTARPLIQRHGNRLTVTGMDAAGGMRADRGKVRQCLLNLLTNAAKFTRDGSVALEARREGRQDGHWLVLTVRDTGVGIAAEELESIFEPFSQAAHEATARAGGTGLGLAICRNFARLMGGDVTVESTPDVGSAFTLALPAGAQRDLLDGDRRSGDDRRQLQERRTDDERRRKPDRRQHHDDTSERSD